MASKALLVIISSPTGGGKNTVITELIKLFPRSTRLITATTREPRPGERDGVDYFFLTRQEFEQKLREGAFIEHNNFAGNLYGTLKDHFDEVLGDYAIVFSHMDVNGKHALDALGQKNLSIFLLPESLDVLRERSKKRKGGMPETVIEERMRIAQREIEQAQDYDYRIVNYEGKLKDAVRAIVDIIREYFIHQPTVDKKTKAG